MADSNFSAKSLQMAIDDKRFAIRLKQDWIPADYSEKVDESILGVKFTPDVFQKQAFYFINQNKLTFVAAHTSAGKTLVAEYAIHRAEQNGTRVIYTSPIKALSNQKFYDFKHKFSDVGLITGDVQVNPEAQCLIMTTEILRNLVYKNSDLLRDTEYVVFDEVHYINDADRGVVWEEAIIMMPRHIALVLLSATIPNAMEFSEWVGRTRNDCVYVISTDKRPVPLEFAIYCDSDAFRLDTCTKTGITASNFPEKLSLYTSKVQPKRRFSVFDLGNYIANRRLTPAIFYNFSRRACEDHGKTLKLLDLTNPMEKKKISAFLDKACSALNEQDRYLPQILTMVQQAARGVAVHHGGLLPFVKECIELLFSQNLIKILVATETFAMGVNMPVKCCAFLSITKVDNGAFRFLTPSEFIQMSGRAGRRGMDKVGTVLIADRKMHPIESVRRMITGLPYDLNSQFKLSFSLILMAFRSNVEVEELMRSSFKEHGAQKSITADMVRLRQLEGIKAFECEACPDYVTMLDHLAFICNENYQLIKRVAKIGDCLILKNNTTVTMEAINSNKLKVVPAEIKLGGKLFSTACELVGDTPCPTSNYCAHSIDRVCPGVEGTISFENIFAMVKDGKIFLDYDITDIHLVETIFKLKNVFVEIQNSVCLACPDFSSHYLLALETVKNNKSIRYIKSKYDKKSLIQIAEYHARLKFLKQHNYIGEFIELKGRVAAEIRTVNEVLVTELIFGNHFMDCSAAELIAIFSSMVHEARGEEEAEPAEEFQDMIELVNTLFESLSLELSEYGIPSMEPLNFNMVGAVYSWCLGDSLGSIVAKHAIQEGTFVRLILRLEECCREMINVANLMGDETLCKKITEASQTIKRDIIFMPSLYI